MKLTWTQHIEHLYEHITGLQEALEAANERADRQAAQIHTLEGKVATLTALCRRGPR